MKDKFNLRGSAKWTWVHMKIQLVSFFLGRVYFLMKLLEFMSKAINRVTTDLEKLEKSGNL